MSEVVKVTEAYYDSKDADEFYYRIWGGEDIHVGTYLSPDESIFEASQRTVKRMAEKLQGIPAGAVVLDIGAGYGGAARFLARQKGYRVHCLNLSKVQNERNRQKNEEQSLSILVDVVDGNFEDLPFGEASMDVVWCQDSLLHSGNRERVFEEVNRVLKPGGHFIFTDPMQSKDADPEGLKPVLERIHLDSMGSPEDYQDYAGKLGWELLEYDDQSQQLVQHYTAVRKNLENVAAELDGTVTPEYIQNMIRGLGHWIKAGDDGQLAWGILHFQKPAQ